MLKIEDWPSLDKILPLSLPARRGLGYAARVPFSTGNGAIFLWITSSSGAPTASMTGYAFPDMLVDLVKLSSGQARATKRTIPRCSFRLIRYEQQPGVGLAVRRYILVKRGAIEHDAQRKPASSLSATARAEVDYLLARLDARSRI